jgi:hypothetical protein
MARQYNQQVPQYCSTAPLAYCHHSAAFLLVCALAAPSPQQRKACLPPSLRVPARLLQGGGVEHLQREVAELQRHIAGQAAAVEAAQAERDAYRMSAQELQERSKVGRRVGGWAGGWAGGPVGVRAGGWVGGTVNRW